jgi:hypothetical protein
MLFTHLFRNERRQETDRHPEFIQCLNSMMDTDPEYSGPYDEVFG